MEKLTNRINLNSISADELMQMYTRLHEYEDSELLPVEVLRMKDEVTRLKRELTEVRSKAEYRQEDVKTSLSMAFMAGTLSMSTALGMDVDK